MKTKLKNSFKISILFLVFCLLINSCYKNASLSQAIKNIDKSEVALPLQLVDAKAFEIFNLQKQYNIAPGEIIKVVAGAKEENDLDRLSKLITSLDGWNKEVYVNTPENEYKTVKNVVRNSSSYPIMQVEFLKNNRALVTTGKIEEKNDGLIVSKGNGEYYYLLKYNKIWIIIYIDEWESVTE